MPPGPSRERGHGPGLSERYSRLSRRSPQRELPGNPREQAPTSPRALPRKRCGLAGESSEEGRKRCHRAVRSTGGRGINTQLECTEERSKTHSLRPHATVRGLQRSPATLLAGRLPTAAPRQEPRGPRAVGQLTDTRAPPPPPPPPRIHTARAAVQLILLLSSPACPQSWGRLPRTRSSSRLSAAWTRR